MYKINRFHIFALFKMFSKSYEDIDAHNGWVFITQDIKPTYYGVSIGFSSMSSIMSNSADSLSSFTGG